MESDALVGIGEFARRSGLAVSALRFYADTDVLRPAAVDATTGYRRYRSSQVAEAIQIRQLRELELPLAEIRRLLELHEPARAAELRRWRDRFTKTTESTIAVVDELINQMDGGHPMATMVTARDWYEAVRQVVPAAGRGDRPALASVLVERCADALRLVATDSWRLCIRDVVPVGADEPSAGQSVAVEAGGLTPFSGYPGDPVDRVVGIDIKVTGVVVRDGADQTTIQRAVGEYPDYRRLVEAVPPSTPAITPRSELAGALLSCGPVAVVELAVARDGIRLSVPGQPEGVAVPCDYGGEPMRVGVQPRFVVDALQAMSGPDVAVDVPGPSAPITLRSAGDGSVLTLVMPVLLSAAG